MSILGEIEIYIAAEKPQGVPQENWLPINRKDENVEYTATKLARVTTPMVC
jgi:hypothetical protein